MKPSRRIGLITYDAPHLKTEQVALGLSARGHRDFVFFALPFTPRPPRDVLFAHRPDMSTGVETEALAASLGVDYRRCEGSHAIDPDGADLFIILGAGLLAPAFVAETSGRVLNLHPGIIPLVRGLDAFKWAILEGMPIGNTLHFIDEDADAGEVIGIWPTPVFPRDTLASLARRHYELEIAMLVGFEHVLESRPQSGDIGGEIRPARRRMPAGREQGLAAAFEAYKSRAASF